MNYANVFGRTQKQFDMTMNREKITVTDFFNSNTKYDVFFRRNQRSTTPQGKVRFFYAQSTPIEIGTIFVLNGSNFIVTSKDGIESNIYFTSMAVKCDTTFVVQSENKYIDVPMSVVSDKWTVAHGSVFSMVNGAVAMFTQDNPVARGIAVDNKYYAFGGYYKVGNTFFNNGLAYFYMERQTMPQDNYKTVYTGVTTLDMNESSKPVMLIIKTDALGIIPKETPFSEVERTASKRLNTIYCSDAYAIGVIDESGIVVIREKATTGK